MNQQDNRDNGNPSILSKGISKGISKGVSKGVSEIVFAYILEDLNVQNAEAVKGGGDTNANIQNHPHQLSLR